MILILNFVWSPIFHYIKKKAVETQLKVKDILCLNDESVIK